LALSIAGVFQVPMAYCIPSLQNSDLRHCFPELWFIWEFPLFKKPVSPLSCLTVVDKKIDLALQQKVSKY
jgi:hypothetical protein